MLRDVAGLDRFVIEGVMVARFLRKAMQTERPTPVDCVIYMRAPKVHQLPGQAAMSKAVHTIFAQWYATHKHVPVFQEEVVG